MIIGSARCSFIGMAWRPGHETVHWWHMGTRLIPFMCQLFFFPLQIQYSLAHAVIEPRPICQALHLCDQQHTNLRDIPAAFHSIHHSIEQLKLSSKPSSQRETVDTPSQRWRVLKSTAGDSKQHRPSDQLKDGSDTITILQLADIHLDKLYSEVGCWARSHSEVGCWARSHSEVGCWARSHSEVGCWAHSHSEVGCWARSHSEVGCWAHFHLSFH